MPTALAVAQATVAKSPVNYVRNGKSYCQTFAGNFWETHFGKPTPNSYASATAAYKASKIVSMDPMAAPPGAYHYFEYGGQGGAGHVGVALGSGLMASGTGYGTNALMNLGKNVLVHRVSDYAKHLKYLGWSYTNGARAQITGLTDHSKPALAANQRQVKATTEARIRKGLPTIKSEYDPAKNLKPNQIVTFPGYVLSEYEGGTVNGSNVWYDFGNHTYVHSSAFTNPDPKGIPLYGTIAPPKPVVKHTVTVRYNNLTADTKQIVVEDGQKIAAPMPPERDDALFAGWMRDGKPYDFAKPVAASFVLDAAWQAKPGPTPEPVEPESDGEAEPSPADPAPVPGDVPNVPAGVVALIGTIVAAVVAAILAAFGIGQ